MPQTETLLITLPADLVEQIRARVSTGEFTSESEAVERQLREASDLSWLPDEPVGMTDAEWEKELQDRLEALDRGEMKTSSAEEVWQRLAAHRAEYLRR